MNKTSGIFLESWPMPINFHEVISLKSFKECFTVKKQHAAKRIQKLETKERSTS